MLRESTFHIKYDKSISITSANPKQGSRFFTLMVDNAIWNYKDNRFNLADKKSGGLIMKILVSVKDSKAIFTFDETNLVLEVVKKE